MNAALRPSPPSGLDRWAASPNRNRRPSLRARPARLCILKGETQRRSASQRRRRPGIEQAAQVGCDWKFEPYIVMVRLTKMSRRSSGSGENRTNPGRPHNETPAFGWTREDGSSHRQRNIGRHSLPVEMLMHRMTCHAVAHRLRPARKPPSRVSVQPPASSVTRTPAGPSSIEVTSVPNSISTPRPSK